MRALFAAAHARGMDDDELRALTPTGSVKALTFPQASQLLNRLNGRGPGYKPPRNRKPRRAPDTFAPLSDEQRDLIDRKLRIALGWTPEQMKAHLEKKHYVSDPSRDMSSIVSTTDGVAVAEHLKKVLRNTLEQHATRIKKYPPVEGMDIAGMMRVLPPYERLSALLEVRRAELHVAMDQRTGDTWLPDQRTVDGRLLMHVAFCADAAALIYRIEAKLREIARQNPGRKAGPENAAALADADEERTFKLSDYQSAHRRAAR